MNSENFGVTELLNKWSNLIKPENSVYIYFVNKCNLEDALLNENSQMFHKRLLDNEGASGSAAGGGLYAHMEKIGLNAEMPIRTWFSRGFAGVLNEVSLQRIWDKVVGGSLIILVYVAVALVETSKMALMQCQTPKEGIRCLVSVCRFSIKLSSGASILISLISPSRADISGDG